MDDGRDERERDKVLTFAFYQDEFHFEIRYQKVKAFEYVEFVL